MTIVKGIKAELHGYGFNNLMGSFGNAYQVTDKKSGETYQKMHTFHIVLNRTTSTLVVAGLLGLGGFVLFGVLADPSMMEFFGGSEKFWEIYTISAISVGALTGGKLLNVGVASFLYVKAVESYNTKI